MLLATDPWGRFYCSSLLTCDALLIATARLLKQQWGIVVKRESITRCPCGSKAIVGMNLAISMSTIHSELVISISENGIC